MNITTEQLGEGHLLIKIAIDEADYRPKFDNGLKDLSKKIQMKGFRVGHAPIGLIKKMYGEELLAEELNKIVNEQVSNYLKENHLDLLGEALPADRDKQVLDYNESKSYDFAYEMGIRPVINMAQTLNKDKVFNYYRIPAKEDEIQSEFSRLRRKYGTRIDVEEVEENDVIYAQLTELNAEGTAKEEGINTETYFNTQMLSESGTALLSGIKNQEAKNIPDLFSVFKGTKLEVAKNVLQMNEVKEEEELAGIGAFELKVTKIARIVPAELNEDFFKAVSQEYGEITNEEELTNNIKDSIESYNDKMTAATLDNEVYKFMEDTTPVPLPEVFLRKWYERSKESSASGEEFEKDFNTFLGQLKQSLIFQTVQKEHDLKVGQDEVIDEAIERVRMSYGHLGDEFVNYILSSQLKEKDFVENMHDKAMQRKFINVLKQYVTIEDKEITLEEYKNLNEEVYAE